MTDIKYGIRRLSTEWCCQGGKNYTGNKEDLTKLVNSWKKEGIPSNVRYTVIPYNGENGTPPAFPAQAENPRNSRMKR